MTDRPVEPAPSKSRRRWWQAPSPGAEERCEPPEPGGHCPACVIGELQFNGLFQLVCPNCGLAAEALVFT